MPQTIDFEPDTSSVDFQPDASAIDFQPDNTSFDLSDVGVLPSPEAGVQRGERQLEDQGYGHNIALENQSAEAGNAGAMSKDEVSALIRQYGGLPPGFNPDTIAKYVAPVEQAVSHVAGGFSDPANLLWMGGGPKVSKVLGDAFMMQMGADAGNKAVQGLVKSGQGDKEGALRDLTESVLTAVLPAMHAKGMFSREAPSPMEANHADISEQPPQPEAGQPSAAPTVSPVMGNPITDKPIQTVGEAAPQLDALAEQLKAKESQPVDFTSDQTQAQLAPIDFTPEEPKPQETKNEQIQPVSSETEQETGRDQPEGIGGVHRPDEIRESGNGEEGGGGEAQVTPPSDFDRFSDLKKQVGEAVAGGKFPSQEILREMEEIKNRQPNKGMPPELAAKESLTVDAFRGESDANLGRGSGFKFYSESPEEASAYGKVRPEKLTFKNPLVTENWMTAKKTLKLPPSAKMDEVLNAAKDKGYDGVSWIQHGKKEYVSFVDRSVNKAEEPQDLGPSMGAKTPGDIGEIAPSHLAQLDEAVKSFSEKPGASPAKAFDLGKTLSAAKDSASQALEGLRAAGIFLIKKQEGKPVFDNFKSAVGDRHLSLSESAINARKFVSDSEKGFKDPLLREAVSNWVDTGGDAEKLKQAMAETPARYKPGYQRALDMTPEEVTFAKNLQNYFSARLEDAQKAGILEQGLEDYIHRMYEKDTPWRQGTVTELRSGVFAGKPTLAKQRAFQYDFEAEKAGYKPVKSFIKRTAAYDLSLNKAIADRELVKKLMQMKMADGRPMIDVAGIGTPIKNAVGETDATLIKPSWKPGDEGKPEANRADFKSYDHPALRKWKWATNDAEGKPIFVQGNVLVHPDALTKVNALLGKSAIRSHPVGRAALNVGSMVKQTMLDLSGFHPVQIGIHGMEHRTFAPVKEIDFTNPDVRSLIRGGLVVGETTGRELFDEGLAGSSLTKFIPGIGPKAAALKDWIFQSYIPRLKVATGLNALERNRKAFPNLSEDEVNHLTANQMNNAFGELNYAMMGRSATMQDAMRLTLLAPDFTEARLGFAGQALTKYGAEQRHALLLGAAALYMTARILNQAISGNPQMDAKNAFSVVYNGKAYGLRTVQGDIIHAATDLPSFIRNRLNPVYGRPIMESLSGRDQFGRKRTIGQQALDVAKTPIPISVRGLFSGREQSLTESLFNSMGITEHRESAANDIYDKAQAWKEKNHIAQEPGEFIYDPDKDQFRQIRLAAMYGDAKAIKEEADKSGLPPEKILQHFTRYGNAPFTGSRAHDADFEESLSDADKSTLKDARAERQKVSQAVLDALQ